MLSSGSVGSETTNKPNVAINEITDDLEKTQEARLRWFGEELMGILGKGYRGRGKQKRRFIDALIEDMTVVEVTEEDAKYRNKSRWKIHCGEPC